MAATPAFRLETPRLLLREFGLADAAALFALNNDPEVLRYTGDLPFASVAAARAFVESYEQYAAYGYGRWAVLLKETSEFLGWCGLKHRPEIPETDLGYRFFRRHWGQGYATEAARACARYGLENLRLPQLVGRVMLGNPASIRVLENAGFSYWQLLDFDGQPGAYYQRLREEAGK
jgi:ribosomal-protein-alanine N-acetyltransferase